MFAGIGSTQALVPPQMMLIEAVGAIASLWREPRHHAALGGIGTGAALLRQRHRGGVGIAPDLAEHLEVPGLRQRAFERDALRLQERMKAHDAEPDRALAQGGVARPLHAVRRDRR